MTIAGNIITELCEADEPMEDDPQAVRVTTDQLWAFLKPVDTLYDAIKHGDENHRAWLKQAIEDHFAGRPVSMPIVAS